MAEAAKGRDWTVHAPPLRDQWGVHHSKAFLVQYERGVRVIVMTANLIYQDCNLKTQGLWYQDFPRLADCALYLPVQSKSHVITGRFRSTSGRLVEQMAVYTLRSKPRC